MGRGGGFRGGGIRGGGGGGVRSSGPSIETVSCFAANNGGRVTNPATARQASVPKSTVSAAPNTSVAASRVPVVAKPVPRPDTAMPSKPLSNSAPVANKPVAAASTQAKQATTKSDIGMRVALTLAHSPTMCGQK